MRAALPSGLKCSSITRAGIWREVLEFVRLPLPLLRVGRGRFFERNIWPDFRVFRIQRQPFLKPRLGVWLDRVDRAFGLAHPAVDALVRMDNEHVLALIEAVDGAHLDAVHKLTANTAIIDDIGQLGVPPQLKTLTNIEIHRFRPRACPNSSGFMPSPIRARSMLGRPSPAPIGEGRRTSGLNSELTRP